MEKMELKPVDWFKEDPKQPRKVFDEQGLRELGESMKARGQQQAVVASPDGTVRIGGRRVAAGRLVGMKELRVIITDKVLSDSELRLIQLTENIQRQDLTGYEQWMACAELMCMNPGWELKDMAHEMKKDPSWATRIMSPSKCIAAWQEALRDGKVGISDCYAASKLPEKEQAGLLALKLSGASRDAIEQAGRKKRNGSKDGVRVQKVRCILPSGVNVVVSGEGVSLDESIEALGEAIKEMKRARELGYTAKTFASAMKDKSKKAG